MLEIEKRVLKTLVKEMPGMTTYEKGYLDGVVSTAAAMKQQETGKRNWRKQVRRFNKVFNKMIERIIKKIRWENTASNQRTISFFRMYSITHPNVYTNTYLLINLLDVIANNKVFER